MHVAGWLAGWLTQSRVPRLQMVPYQAAQAQDGSARQRRPAVEAAQLRQVW